MAGLYVHIPFCHSKCTYCDFFSTPTRKDEGSVVDGIIKEFSARRSEVADIKTLYLGGGTPSILTDENLQRLLKALPASVAEEVTIEANPEDVTREKVEFWRSLGVNRVSMGVQSLIDSELSLIGRRHNSREALDAVKCLRDAGIKNISLDLIYGLPTQTLESWTYSLRALLDTAPEHLSAYILSYEHGTRLTAMLKAGKIEGVEEDALLHMYDTLVEETRIYGYEHYEISNFAKPGFRSRHNSNYWLYGPYLGLGPAAHSFDGAIRRVNPSSITTYLEGINERGHAYEEEKESKTDRFNDLIITALRTSDGLEFQRIPRRRRTRFMTDAFDYIRSGHIRITDNRVSIPEKYWPVSDAILRDLIQIDDNEGCPLT